MEDSAAGETTEPGRLRPRWSWSIGEDRLKVTVFEHPTKGMLYLRWRVDTGTGRNWRHESLGVRLVDGRGRIIREHERLGKEQARLKYRALGEPPVVVAPPPPPEAVGLQLGQTEALVIDPDRGLYPRASHHRSEVLRALLFAVSVWGKDRAWSTIRRSDLRALWRRRLDQLQRAGHAGARGAEVTVSRVLTIAAWLRDEELIPPGSCLPPRKWKQLVREEAGNPDTHRPRYTVAEMRKILDAAPSVDPRFGLLCELGAKLRLGQVVRMRRSDLDLKAGTYTVRGRGKKKGTVCQFTPGQQAAVNAALGTGYLRVLDRQTADFPLFPGGRLVKTDTGLEAPVAGERGHLTRRWVTEKWRRAEALAGVPRVEGRGPYGARRASVDGLLGEGISPKALENAGGWENAQMPNQVYADRDLRFAREEAAAKWAKVRGEKTEETR